MMNKPNRSKKRTVNEDDKRRGKNNTTGYK